MAEKRRLSILTLMMVVSLAAADCAILRAVWDSWAGLALIVMPMLNVMLYGLMRLRRRPASRPFWVTFEVVGATMVGLLALVAWADAEFLLHPVLWLYEHGWLSEAGPKDLVIACLCVIGIYTPPQLLAASFAGWFSARYRVVIERRPGAAVRDHPGPTLERAALAPESRPIGDDRRAVTR